MQTTTITPDEMERRTVRFRKLDSYQAQHGAAAAIPTAAFEQIAAHRVYPIMVPADYAGRSVQAPLKGAPGLALTIAECPPGNGAGLHAHEQSVENFFCLSGRFEIAWGDHGEHKTVLEPMDMVSIPPGICRSFKNLASETGRLLVMIQILTAEQADRVHFTPSVGDDLARQFGGETVDALRQIGFLFDAGVPAA
jgi:uncharacterized RmlC-like cupin family protein